MRLTRSQVKSFLPTRPKHAHKGTFGRVLVVAGSGTMAGAGVLCARAALRTGAGLVCLALPQSRQCVAAAAVPESLTLGLPEKNGVISAQAAPILRKFITEFQPSVLLIGPGLTKAPFIIPFLRENTLPTVLDADALNTLAESSQWEKIVQGKFPLICTPHPGEMKRLIKQPSSLSEIIRIKQACELSKRTGGVSVLKGFHSIVTDGKIIYTNPTGSSALAKAGSGDVLGGMIAGLWAQCGMADGFNNNTALRAAAVGVYLHGLSGDLAAQKVTDRAVLASEVTDQLPVAWKRLLRA